MGIKTGMEKGKFDMGIITGIKKGSSNWQLKRELKRERYWKIATYQYGNGMKPFIW